MLQPWHADVERAVGLYEDLIRRIVEYGIEAYGADAELRTMAESLMTTYRRVGRATNEEVQTLREQEVRLRLDILFQLRLAPRGLEPQHLRRLLHFDFTRRASRDQWSRVMQRLRVDRLIRRINHPDGSIRYAMRAEHVTTTGFRREAGTDQKVG